MSDLVSIIMPSYNTAQYITETIQSVIDQTYHNWEYAGVPVKPMRKEINWIE